MGRRPDGAEACRTRGFQGRTALRILRDLLGEDLTLSLDDRETAMPAGRFLGPTPMPPAVRRYHVWLLRLMFGLMATFLASDVWSQIVSADGSWEPREAAAWTMWAGFSLLALLGIVNPLKMLPLVLLEIFYKALWLAIVAFPLWQEGNLAGSAAEETTFTFLLVVLPIVGTPWRYVWHTYFRNLRYTDARPRAG
jgi:hypothetical protein